MLTKVLLLITVIIENYNIWIWLNIDRKHRRYYSRFVLNAWLCIVELAYMLITQYKFNIFYIPITFILVAITIHSKNCMLEDLRNEKYIKLEQNKKGR